MTAFLLSWQICWHFGKFLESPFISKITLTVSLYAESQSEKYVDKPISLTDELSFDNNNKKLVKYAESQSEKYAED